jgi:hypothetical protein
VIAALTSPAAIVGIESDIWLPAFLAGTISIQFPSLARTSWVISLPRLPDG